MTNGATAAAAGAAAAIAQAIKASGAIVSLEPMEFEKLLGRAESPLVVAATGGWFSTHYKYIMGHRGLAFYTKSPEPLRLPEGADVVTARAIWIPG
ncbi:MAG: hypothetical protein ACYSU0_17165 [Planctomycetota bacterium]|jgi:hypothetical protein